VEWELFEMGLKVLGYEIKPVDAEGVELARAVWTCPTQGCGRSAQVEMPAVGNEADPRVLEMLFEQANAMKNVERGACGH
jgi:hypothetical protein